MSHLIRATLFANSAIFVSGTLRVKTLSLRSASSISVPLTK